MSSFPSTPSFRLDHRRALVTGAGRGIGAAAAAALSDAGASVTLVSRSAAELELVADELRKRGGQAQALVLDCPRRPNFDPPCRLNFDPGLVAEIA